MSSSNTTTIRLGTASPAAQATTAATLAQLAALARRAAAQHIDLLLLPEAYIGGYPRGTHFGCVVGDRTLGGRDEFARHFDRAVDLGDVVGDGGGGGGERWVKRQLGGGDGGSSSSSHDDANAAAPKRGDGTREALERIARDTGVFLVVGLIERAGGTLYCAAVYVCPKEGMLGKRRKVMPTGTERLIWGQGSPSTLRAISTTIRGARVNLAAAICWENYMPLLRQSLYAQNINLYLAPTADSRDAWMSLVRTIAVEGRCFVVSSNMCERKAEGDTAAAADGGINGIDDTHGAAAAAAPAPPRRRNSTITADGNEIALPCPREQQQPNTTRRRRMSVFDSDGNEIVLGCLDDDSVASTQQQHQPAVNGTTPSAPPLSVSSPSKAAGATAGSAPGWVSRGGSSIVSPFGDVLAGPQWEDAEGLIYADVDLRDCIRGRLDLDAAGSYSRNDSFKLSVTGLDLDPLPY